MVLKIAEREGDGGEMARVGVFLSPAMVAGLGVGQKMEKE